MGGLFSSFLLLLLLAMGAAGGEEPREPVMKSIFDSWKSLRNGFSSCSHVYLKSESIFSKRQIIETFNLLFFKYQTHRSFSLLILS